MQQFQGRRGFFLPFYATFTLEADFRDPGDPPIVIDQMGYFAGVRDLRNLLSVAAKLRRLADDTWYPNDKHLYLTAAALLEARGERMALHLPDEPYDRAQDAALHRPVDMMI